MKKPILVVPMGDPAGIGPEIVVKSLADEKLAESRVVVVGDLGIINQAIEICKVDLKVKEISKISEALFEKGTLNLINLNNIDMSQFKFGEVSGMCGKAAYDCIVKCIELAMNHEADAVVTPPINKESFKAGGVNFIGHTEVFGHHTNTADPLTLFEVKGMRVFFLSRHVSLRKSCDMVTKDRIKDYVKRCDEVLKKLGVQDGTMAIAGLNPHCGEHGLFGDEEVREVMPAVEELQKEGYKVVGPIGADSVFWQALQGKYTSVLSLYHDQGHIATKTVDFNRTISITGGMPILRTSVDHGTAFDIAGKGIANEISMIEALVIGEKYAKYFVAE